MDEKGNELSVNSVRTIYPYGESKPKYSITIGEPKLLGTLKVEHNSYTKFQNYFKEDTRSKEASAALVEHTRSSHFEKLLESNKAIFYVPELCDFSLDLEDGTASSIFNDICSCGLLINLKNTELLQVDNKVIKFYGAENVAIYELSGIRALTFVQRAVLRAVYDKFTKLASSITPVYQSFNQREIKALKAINPQRSNADIERELKQGYELSMARDVSRLYEQLYFEIEDFVEFL